MARIVVGVDGSEESKAALRWAIEEARLRGVTVRAVCAWSLPHVAGPGFAFPYVAGPGFAFPPGSVEEFRRDVEGMLDAAMAEVGSEGVDIERAAVEGGPARVLVEAAEGADLLVVGSRGHGGFTGLLLGRSASSARTTRPAPWSSSGAETGLVRIGGTTCGARSCPPCGVRRCL